MYMPKCSKYLKLTWFDKLLFKVVPIIYTDNLPEKYGAMTYCGFIKVRPKYKEDLPLHVHELTHIKQIIRTAGLHCLLYRLSKTYRLKAEVEAYARQICCIGNLDYVDFFARMLAEKYKLDIEPILAKTYLHRQIRRTCPEIYIGG